MAEPERNEIGEYLLSLHEKQPKSNQLSGGAYMEHLMKKGEFGQLSAEEVKILQTDFHFKPESFVPVTTGQGTSWKLVPPVPPRQLGLTIIGDPNAE